MENVVQTLPLAAVALLLVVGFVFLIKGADFFVEGSSSLAKKFHVPTIIIGLTVVAMGTSLPETAVSVTASITNNNALAISNAIGSNIFNLMVVIGLCAIMTPVLVAEDTIKRDIPFSVLCAVLLLGLGLCPLFDQAGRIVGHIDGLVLLALFVTYIVVLVKRALKAKNTGMHEKIESEIEEEVEEEIHDMSLWKCLLFIVGGAAAIAFGGDLSVKTATRIALDMGMSQTLVGLTIVSVGTSLPELVTSVVAARKNEIDMALGNAIGSNVFNILMVLGIASAISPIAIISENIIDIAVLVVFSLIVWIFAATKRRLSKMEGFLMVAMYAVYAVYICIR